MQPTNSGPPAAGSSGSPGEIPYADAPRFFKRLMAGAGVATAIEAAEIASGDRLTPAVAPETNAADRKRALADLCRDLGLEAAAIRPGIDEALALVEPLHPVLLVLRRAGRIEFVAVLESHEDLDLRLEILAPDRLRRVSSSRRDVAEHLGLEDATLEAACRISTVSGGRDHDSDGPKKDEDSVWPRLWRFLAPDRTELVIVVCFAIGLGVLTLATPIAVQSLVNFVAFGGLIQPLIVVGLLLFFFLAFAGAIRVFKFYVVEILQRRLFVRVASSLSTRLPQVRAEAYDGGYGPELVNRFFDVLTVQKAGATLLVGGLDVLLQAGIGLIVLGFYHPFLLVFDLVLIVAIGFVLFVFGRNGIRTALKESKAKYEVAGALEELARAPLTYKLAGAPQYARARLAQLAGNYIGARRKHYGVVLRQMIGAVSLHAIAGTALLTLGGFLVIRGQLTLGQLVAAELIVSVALVSFVKFGKEIEAFYDLAAGVDKLGVLFDLPLEVDRGEPHVPSTTGAALELRQASYRYDRSSHSGTPVSVSVRPGERVAVLGARGSGKSTAAQLVAGLREPTSGVAMFDGVDVRDIAKASLRSQMYLAKGFEVVEGSVIDNVRLGRNDVTVADVQNVLARLGILDDLMAQRDGLRTELSVFGTPLSHTTAQLLVLARAVVGRPRAIVIDGVLDELDNDALRRALAILTDRDAPWTLLVFTSREDVSDALGGDRTVVLGPQDSTSVAATVPVASLES